MKFSDRSLWIVPVALAALFLGAATPAADRTAPQGDDETPFDEADLFFELNDTDGDLGLHALIDGDAWKSLEIENPAEREQMRVTVSGNLRRQGLTELFFESAEPPFDELPPEQFFLRFPEGEWEIEGITLDGEELESEDVLSHVMPAPPDNITLNGVPSAEDCDADPLPSVTPPVLIDWDPVTESHPEIGREGEIEIVRYQLVLETAGPLNLTLDLPPEVTEFEVPAEIIAMSDEWKFEIVAREETGNQTAVESCFLVE